MSDDNSPPADAQPDTPPPDPTPDPTGSNAGSQPEQADTSQAAEPTPDPSGSNAGPTPPPDTSDQPEVADQSTSGDDAPEITYAIGVPGQHPRIIVTTSDPNYPATQAQNGEVYFEVDTFPAEPYAITADGTALETVPPKLIDVQAAARRAALAAYETKVALYQSSIGLVQLDEASQASLTTAFVNAFFFGQPNDGTTSGPTAGALMLRWRLADNTFAPPFAGPGATGFSDFVKECLGFAGRCRQHYWTIVDQVQAATTNDQVIAIDVTAGYPSL